MHQPKAGYPGAAQAPVPQQLQQTLEWLIHREEYRAAQALLRAIGRVLLAEVKADGKLYAIKIISKKNMRQVYAISLLLLVLRT